MGPAVLEAGHTSLEARPGVDMERLIGVPHLFGRLFHTRDGYLVVPIGVLTLQPDGTVSGHSHPNEGGWRPYQYGTVGSDRAFAFITAGNTWVPSSTWQHSIGDIAVGYFCDEPEAPQQLCLIPHQPFRTGTHVVYLVASCLKFYQRTVPALLEQLFDEGIEPARIKVIVNGCSDADERTAVQEVVEDGVAYAFSTHNAWEWSALYEAPRRWTFDYAMLVHDTVRIFPGFRRKVERNNGHIAWDHLPATPMARCLIGLYSHDYLRRLNPWLESLHDISKKDGVMAEVGGELLLRARTALAIGDPEHNGAARPAEWREIVDPFGTGAPRVRRVFPSINLHKFLHTPKTDPASL